MQRLIIYTYYITWLILAKGFLSAKSSSNLSDLSQKLLRTMPESSSTARAPHSQQECLVFKRAAVSTSSNLVSSTSKLPFKISYLGSSNPSEKREVTPKKLPTKPARLISRSLGPRLLDMSSISSISDVQVLQQPEGCPSYHTLRSCLAEAVEQGTWKKLLGIVSRLRETFCCCFLGEIFQKLQGQLELRMTCA